MAEYTCAHCGLTAGNLAGGYAGVRGPDGSLVRVCHPNDPSRPDCYRRVTIWAEPLGTLRGRSPLPPGITGISPEDDAFQALVALGEELGT
jgi:hypothetical protein